MKNHCDFHYVFRDRIITVLNQVNCISCKGRLFSGFNNAKSIEAFTAFWCFLNMVWDSFSKNSFSALDLHELLPRQSLINCSQQSAFNIFLPYPLFRFCLKLHINISAFIYKNKNHNQTAQTCAFLLWSFRFWGKDKKGALKNPKTSLLVFSIPWYHLARIWALSYWNQTNSYWWLFLEVTFTFKKENIPSISIRAIYPSPSSALSKLSGCNNVNLRSETNGILFFYS